MRSKITPMVIGVFFIFLLTNTASAQIETLKSASDTSPSIALERVISVLVSKANDLKKSLSSLKNLTEDQKLIREEFLAFLDQALAYYQSLEISPDGSNVKNLATELKNKRESVFNVEIKKITDFILVFQTKSILRVAENRFVKINSDVNRLLELKIFKNEKPQFLLNEAHLLLVGAADLEEQAEGLVSTTTESKTDVRDLIAEALAKIKLAYKKFLEISNLLKEALK